MINGHDNFVDKHREHRAHFGGTTYTRPIAVQSLGSISVFIHGIFSNLDILWEEPRVARFLLALGRLGHVIIIDRRGTGLSDRVTPPAFEINIDDILVLVA
jgi:pimeloyl-ACP methyl ester carboxylesterase